MAKYELIPEPVPPPGRGTAGQVYTSMLDDFLAMKDESVRVEFNRKPNTIYISLKRAAKSDAKYDGIKVSKRGDHIYLIRT